MDRVWVAICTELCSYFTLEKMHWLGLEKIVVQIQKVLGLCGVVLFVLSG